MTGIELFEYESNGWLSWRYSFKVPDAQDKMNLIQKFRALNIPFSHLYQPLPQQIQGIQSHGGLKNTDLISRQIVNLKYSMDLNTVKSLLDKLQCLKRTI